MPIRISWREVEATPFETYVLITAVTDIPCHCWIRVSKNPPDVHRVPAMKRGLSMPEEYYFCFTASNDYDEEDFGDHLIHRFIVPDWPYCVTKSFYFFGMQGTVYSPSTSAAFVYHNNFIVAKFELLFTERWTKDMPEWNLHFTEPWSASVMPWGYGFIKITEYWSS